MPRSRWRFPDLRNGTTLHHITDTHFGYQSGEYGAHATSIRTPYIEADLEALRAVHSGHIHSGDLVDWNGVPADSEGNPQPPEDDLWRAFEQRVTAADGHPFVKVPGNHDLQSYGPGTPHRTSMEWARAMGMSHFNTVTDMGGVRVIGLGPDEWRYATNDGPSGGDFVLSQKTLTWLDEQLTAAGARPVVLTTHTPPWEQYDRSFSPRPRGAIDDLIGSHSNVKLWLSGHRHADVMTDGAHAQVVEIGGRNVAVVNGPTTGARCASVEEYWDMQYASPCLSIFVTVLDGAIDVRWRDHLARRWVSSVHGDVHHLLVPDSAGPGDHILPTTLPFAV